MKYTQQYDLSLIGCVSLVEEDGCILAFDMIRKDGGVKSGPLAADAAREETSLLREARRQLEALSGGPPAEFRPALGPTEHAVSAKGLAGADRDSLRRDAQLQADRRGDGLP